MRTYVLFTQSVVLSFRHREAESDNDFRTKPVSTDRVWSTIKLCCLTVSCFFLGGGRGLALKTPGCLIKTLKVSKTPKAAFCPGGPREESGQEQRGGPKWPSFSPRPPPPRLSEGARTTPPPSGKGALDWEQMRRKRKEALPQPQLEPESQVSQFIPNGLLECHPQDLAPSPWGGLSSWSPEDGGSGRADRSVGHSPLGCFYPLESNKPRYLGKSMRHPPTATLAPKSTPACRPCQQRGMRHRNPQLVYGLVVLGWGLQRPLLKQT